MSSDDAALDGPTPLAPGDVAMPGYRVVTHLRRGHDLDVYDLWSDARDCRVIGKMARPDRVDKRGVASRLLEEGRLLRRLSHPHIVRAYEVIAGPPPVVVLETLPGETLAALSERVGRLPAREVAQLGVHLASALTYLHRQNILHLDLKPGNIIVSQGLAKVLDLSLGRPPGRARPGRGTTGYMSPEQIAGGQLTSAADTWGLGATLFELLTGEYACDLPDDGRTSTGASASEVCVPPPVRRYRRLAGPLPALIDACLHPDPGKRPDLQALRIALEAIVNASSDQR
ncbi:MAG: serine/threonine-protein kinase [Thermomicrobiales bacterium]